MSDFVKKRILKNKNNKIYSISFYFPDAFVESFGKALKCFPLIL